jgi:hypothetical protein
LVLRSNRVFGWTRLFLAIFFLSLLAACAQGSDGAATAGPGTGTGAGSSSGTDGGGTAGGDTGGSTGGGTSGGTCSDTCGFSGRGITWGCQTRFMYGTNYAWRSFGTDFGGVSSWGYAGISGNPGPFSDQIAQMKANGVSVIRWWMFPRFLTDTIQWGSDGAPSGISQTLVADVQKALELAAQHDVYLMLTPFSFDNFRPTTTENGVYSRSLAPMVRNAALRQKLVDNLLGPIADAIAQSPHKDRLVAWDIINEPEWAMTGPSLHGDPAFPAQGGLDLVTHQEMQDFVKAAGQVLRRSGALISVGGAAIKWPKAWSQSDLDFYQFHYYDWVYQNFPYQTVTLESVGVTDKPVVMGEFPSKGLSASGGLPARTAAQFSQDLMAKGYAGTLSWAFTDGSFPFDAGSTKAFADANGCGVKY